MQWLLRPTFRVLLNEGIGNAHDATHSVGSHAVRDDPLLMNGKVPPWEIQWDQLGTAMGHSNDP